MKYSFKDIINSYTKEKRKRSSWWARLVSRPISFVFTYLFINMGISANIVSIISILEVLIACILIMIGGQCTIWGVFLYVFWHVLDCVDGNIARIKKESSYVGAFLDAVSGYTAPAFIFLSVGVAAYHTTNLLNEYKYVFIILGAIGSISDLFSRIIYQKYLVTEYRLGVMDEKENIDTAREKGLSHIADIIMKNLSYSCMFMPLLIIALFTNRFDLLIFVYSVYLSCVLVMTVGYFIKKSIELSEKMEDVLLCENMKDF